MSETKKVLTATDKATKTFTVASQALQANVAQFTEIAASLATDIEFKQSELDNIQVGIDVAVREAKAETSLQIRENSEKVLATLLKERNLAQITNAEVEELRNDLSVATQSVDVAVNKGIGAAVAKVQSENAVELAQLKAEQSVETAELKADIKSLTSRIQSLTETNVDLKGMLDEERKARVAVAEAARPQAQPQPLSK